MKPLKDTLNESLLDDEDELFDRNDKTLIELWIKENYKIYGALKIHEDKHGFVVDSNDKIEVTNKDIKSLTNGMFQWGEITGGFDCSGCTELRSLEGAPNKCNWFDCFECTELRSLKGAPNECEDFNCFGCTELMTLEGAPKKCIWLNCSGCTELISLKGAPNKCDWLNCSECTELRTLEGAPNKCIYFNCAKCTELRSLKGAPNKCWGCFNCSECTGLRSLEGAPVGTTIKCSDCTNLIITDDDHKKYKISL